MFTTSETELDYYRQKLNYELSGEMPSNQSL